MTVNMEYELNNPRLVLQDLKITIPIPGGRSPVVENVSDSNLADYRALTPFSRRPMVRTITPTRIKL